MTYIEPSLNIFNVVGDYPAKTEDIVRSLTDEVVEESAQNITGRTMKLGKGVLDISGFEGILSDTVTLGGKQA